MTCALRFLSTKDNEAFFFFFSVLFLTWITNTITPFPLQSPIFTFTWGALAVGLCRRTPPLSERSGYEKHNGPQLLSSGSISTLAPSHASHGLLPTAWAQKGYWDKPVSGRHRPALTQGLPKPCGIFVRLSLGLGASKQPSPPSGSAVHCILATLPAPAPFSLTDISPHTILTHLFPSWGLFLKVPKLVLHGL